MSEEAEVYVSMKVKNFKENPVPSVQKLCTGGCGDMVWVDKKLEHVWSKIPILCMECALLQMDALDEDITITVLPESLQAMMMYHLEKKRQENGTSKNR
ncbi:hypothetical protein LCGC14_2784260 [marine sediment metagenome]|uniref:Uncharacterized protein n=1 Tax=marine sediment metagenome TaxID=412755 RepID=A0A0F8YSF9_9ZZZZ